MSMMMISPFWRTLEGGPKLGPPFKNEQGGSIFINESSLYSLIFGSRLESAKNFKRWEPRMYYHPFKRQVDMIIV